jgi:hypothetical protein
MKIPAWLRKKPSGTRSAQQLRDDCAHWEQRAHDWEKSTVEWQYRTWAAESKLAEALVQKDDWVRSAKDWQQDVMRWRVHAQAAESKLAAALVQKDEWKHYALDCRDRAGVAESKLAARQASLAKYEAKRKAKRAAEIKPGRSQTFGGFTRTGWSLK